MKTIISCFDKSTVFAQPWAAHGYLCYCVDIQHPAGETKDGNIIKVGADMLEWLPPRKDIVFAAFFPPCTDVAISGARWFKDKGIGALIRALKLFDASIKFAEWCNAPYFIENPVSTISTYWRKPDYMFHPYEYGGYLPPEERKIEGYTKKTCIWCSESFIMPKKRPVEITMGSKMHLLPPSKDRVDLRSQTPRGFAQAIFEANHEENKK